MNMEDSEGDSREDLLVSICRICEAMPCCTTLRDIFSRKLILEGTPTMDEGRECFGRICEQFASVGLEAQKLWLSIAATRLCADMPKRSPALDVRARFVTDIQGWRDLSVIDDSEGGVNGTSSTSSVPTLPSQPVGVAIFTLSCALAKQPDDHCRCRAISTR